MSDSPRVEAGQSEAPQRRSGRAAKAAAAPVSINMTPMIDIVFQLLIYFLLGTQLRTTEEGLAASKLPATTGQTSDPSQVLLRPIKIQLRRIGEGVEPGDCQIVVENFTRQPQDFLQLTASLVSLKEQPDGAYSEESPVLLLPGSEVRYQHVVDAFNAVTRARFKKISFGGR